LFSREDYLELNHTDVMFEEARVGGEEGTRLLF